MTGHFLTAAPPPPPPAHAASTARVEPVTRDAVVAQVALFLVLVLAVTPFAAVVAIIIFVAVGPCTRAVTLADLAAFKGVLALLGLVWTGPAIAGAAVAWSRLRWLTPAWALVVLAQLSVVLAIVVKAEPAPLCM